MSSFKVMKQLAVQKHFRLALRDPRATGFMRKLVVVGGCQWDFARFRPVWD